MWEKKKVWERKRCGKRKRRRKSLNPIIKKIHRWYVIHNEINLLFHTPLRITRLFNGLYNNHMRLRECDLLYNPNMWIFYLWGIQIGLEKETWLEWKSSYRNFVSRSVQSFLIIFTVFMLYNVVENFEFAILVMTIPFLHFDLRAWLHGVFGTCIASNFVFSFMVSWIKITVLQFDHHLNQQSHFTN